MLLLAALVLLIVPVPVGVDLLDTEVPERREPAAIGFVPPRPADRDRGMALGMSVTVRDCSEPASVVLVVAGTAEYWRAHGRGFPRRAVFRLAIPDVLDGDVDVFAGTAASEVTNPLDAPTRRPRGPSAERLSITKRRSAGELEIVRGQIGDWTATLAPVVSRFKAPWVERTGIGSCIVRTPALAGDLSVLAAQEAAGRADAPELIVGGPEDLTVFSTRTERAALYEPAYEPAFGSTTVIVERGNVDGDDSLPNPDKSVNGNPTWTCDIEPRQPARISKSGVRSGDLLLGDSGLGSAGALSDAAVKRGPTQDCSAVVSVTEATGPRKRDLVILLVGAIMSLGGAILVELGLEQFRKRRDA